MSDYAVEPENVGCCYSVINRVNDSAGKKYSRESDNQYSVTECSDFKSGLVLKSEEEFILVRCFQENENGTNKDIYKNTHAVVPMKAAVKLKDPAGKKYSGDSDNQYSVTECSDFKSGLVLKSEEEFILVRCFQENENGTNKDIYKNTHAVVPMKAAVKLKLNKISSEISSMGENRLSVLLLGFDAVSRLNLLRTMPKTVKYLRSSGWLEMSGYNKVGDNTLPNLAAVVTGLTMDQLKNQCWTSPYTPFDKCPFIWKDYSELGYVTAYAEDQPPGSTFRGADESCC